MNDAIDRKQIDLLASEKFDLQDYIFTLKRHKWSIFSFSCLVVMITAIVVYSMNPVYRAKSTLLIESQQAKIVSIEEIYGLDTTNSEYYATQFEILKSREIAEKVIERLALKDHPEYQSSSNFSDFLAPVKAWIQKNIPIEKLSTTLDLSTPEETIESDEELMHHNIVRKFISQLSIEPIRKTQLVNIIFESRDRHLAAKAANAISDVYIESHLEARLQMTKTATSWLTERMETMKKKLSGSEKKLQRYREKENIIELEGIRTLAAKDLQEISTNYISAKERRSKAQNLYKQINLIDDTSENGYESIPIILKNDLIQNLKKAESQSESRLAELAKRYGPQHPKMIAARSKLDKTRENIGKQIKTVISGIEKEYQIAKSNEQTLKRAIEKSKKEIQSLNRKEFKLKALEREADTNRRLYDTFFNRFQETSATGDLQTVNARIMDRAVTPLIPAKPKKGLSLLIALFASLIFGVARALLREHLGNTIRSTEDVESKLGLPSIGILPLTKSGPLKRLKALEIFSRSEYVPLAEAIRTIRTGLLLSSLETSKKVTLVTSSIPNEGKTTLSIGLAVALGQVEKVLLIDADLRHPSLTKNFELPTNTSGLSTFIAGSDELDNCIHATGKAGIDLMPSGLTPPNPLELLSSKRLKSVMEELEKRYDRIIIDSAPTQAVSDALILSSHAQSVIYLVKADSTPAHVANSGIKRLLNSNAPLTGVVLNQLDVKKALKFSNYEYYGDGYYGQYGTSNN